MPKLPGPRRLPVVCMVPLLLASLGGGAFGQPAPETEDPLPGAEPEITVGEEGTVEMHVSDLPLSTVLQVLSIESKRNIIASPADW